MSRWIVLGSTPAVGSIDVLGAVVMTWSLSSAPDSKWAKDFDMASVAYSGPGTLDFDAIAHPAIAGAEVSWRVPDMYKEHAEQYLLQRVCHANAQVTSQGPLSPLAEYLLDRAKSTCATGRTKQDFLDNFDEEVLVRSGARRESIGEALSEAMTDATWPW
jgi:hypothetical protein